MNRLVLQFTAHLHLKNYSESSVQSHRLDLMRFKGWLEGQEQAGLEQVRTLSPREILRYQADLSRVLKPRSVSRHLSSLRLFFRFMEDSGLIEANPMDNVIFPKALPVLPAMLLPSEVATLLETPEESHYLGLRDRAMLELLYSTGVKLNEMTALNVEHVDLPMRLLRVTGKRARLVPLTDRAVVLLERFMGETRISRLRSPEDLCLFPGRNGTRITRVGVWKLIKKHAQTAGIDRNFNPRSLRHAFAIHLILGGMDLDGIKFLFGYKRLEATTLYAHVNTPNFREAYRQFHPLADGE